MKLQPQGRPRIVPHLWYATEAKEAAEFYAALFPDSKISSVKTLHGTPSGDTDIVSFELHGQPFMAISAGPYFTFNPSISFIVNFDPARENDAPERIDQAWDKLSQGGKVLMPIQEYPFSKRYGWVQDRYGLSWQLILTDPEGEERPAIVPSLLFTGDVYAKAEEAVNFYTSVFPDSRKGEIFRYGLGQDPDRVEAVMFSDFRLLDTWFAAMDSARQHDFKFNEAISFMVSCKGQDEIDFYWGKLSAVPEAEQCGWLKDKFGISWQIVPKEMDEMMSHGTPEQIGRVTQAFLPMKKFDIAKLREAYDG